LRFAEEEEEMSRALLALALLAAVFLRRLMMPMIFGFIIGTGVYFAAPMLEFTASPELIIFCGLAGLTLGLVRSILWIPGVKKDN